MRGRAAAESGEGVQGAEARLPTHMQQGKASRFEQQWKGNGEVGRRRGAWHARWQGGMVGPAHIAHTPPQHSARPLIALARVHARHAQCPFHSLRVCVAGVTHTVRPSSLNFILAARNAPLSARSVCSCWYVGLRRLHVLRRALRWPQTVPQGAIQLGNEFSAPHTVL